MKGACVTSGGFRILGLGHLNIVVDDIGAATGFYASLLGAVAYQEFPHFKNRGFALSAGFLENPELVDVSIRFLKVPGSPLVLELMQYHNPAGEALGVPSSVTAQGGIRHVALQIQGIDAAFDFVKRTDGVTLIRAEPGYSPHRIDDIHPHEFHFLDRESEADPEAKADVCRIVSHIRYFYFIDKYGVQWELEEGHTDVGSGEGNDVQTDGAGPG